MRRRNLAIGVGALVVLAAPVLHLTVFVRYPATRDVPWATALLFVTGLGMIGLGLRRAWSQPLVYRGRIAGTVVACIGVLLFGLFGFVDRYLARQLPGSAGAPRVGDRAPDFTLPDKDGNPVTLSRLLEPAAGGGSGAAGALLIFYRGYW